MNRRTFLAATGGGILLNESAWSADSKPQIIEMRTLKMRNTLDGMAQRTNDFLEKAYIPALQKAGAVTVGAFSALVAPDSPFLLLVSSYPSLGSWEGAYEKLRTDASLTKAREAYYGGGLGYTRMQVDLFQGFRTVPVIEVPAVAEGKPPRIFEVRRYESNSPVSLAKKVKMFDDGEIGIFRRLGMKVVFFGGAIAGSNLPNLTYMLGYDDLAHRERVWGEFGKDPEWQKMRATPGLSDAEIVSNITNYFVRPTGFSAIR